MIEVHSSLEKLRSKVRVVRDFPNPGILFQDITPVLADPSGLRLLCDALASPYQGIRVSKVLAIESRGFFLGAGVAERLNAGFVPVRKKGKLPWNTLSESYALEYGEAILEVHEDAVAPGEPVIIVDDVLATGGTLAATCALVSRVGGETVGCSTLIEIQALHGRKKVSCPVHSLWAV